MLSLGWLEFLFNLIFTGRDTHSQESVSGFPNNGRGTICLENWRKNYIDGSISKKNCRCREIRYRNLTLTKGLTDCCPAMLINSTTYTSRGV